MMLCKDLWLVSDALQVLVTCKWCSASTHDAHCLMANKRLNFSGLAHDNVHNIRRRSQIGMHKSYKCRLVARLPTIRGETHIKGLSYMESCYKATWFLSVARPVMTSATAAKPRHLLQDTLLSSRQPQYIPLGYYVVSPNLLSWSFQLQTLLTCTVTTFDVWNGTLKHAGVAAGSRAQ